MVHLQRVIVHEDKAQDLVPLNLLQVIASLYSLYLHPCDVVLLDSLLRATDSM